jgi:sugar phosphate isomerase/epimerase
MSPFLRFQGGGVMVHFHLSLRSQWTRRESLKAMGATVISLPFFAAQSVDHKNKARQNLKLAVLSTVYKQYPLETAARKINEDGFSGVVSDFIFSDVKFDGLSPDWGAARKITSCFERHGLKLAGIAAYYNVVDPDAERRVKGEKRIRCYLENWKRLGSPIICTGSGSFNRESEWSDSPENEKEAGYLECRSRIQDLVTIAQKTGAILAIEAYWKNVINSPLRNRRLFNEIDSPALGLVMDPCNYFRNQDLPKMRPMLEEIFRSVGKKTVLAHAKDLKGSLNGPDLPAAGLGVLDYPLYLELLAGLDKPLYLALEHLGPEDVPRARKYVLDQFEKIS